MLPGVSSCDGAIARLRNGELFGRKDGTRPSDRHLVCGDVDGLDGAQDGGCGSIGSRQGCNHHNLNEHPRSPKLGCETGPHRSVCRIDPLIPDSVVIFE